MEWFEDSGVKRFFRARSKLNYPGTVSHITQRAAGADSLFHETDDYLEMLGRLKKVAEDFELEVFSFVLMPNHIHLEVRQKEKNLPEAMRELFSRYARRHNVKYERKGHLMGGPYRQAVCLDQAYMLTLSLYIHLNPVRAGLVEHPEDYRWSSARMYTRVKKVESFVCAEPVLGLISDDRKEAVQYYKQMLEHGKGIKTGEVLEDQEAIHQLQWRMKASGILGRLKALSPWHDLDPVDENELTRLISSVVERQAIQLPKERAARRYLVEQLISRGYTRKEIARRLGISRKTVYNLLKNRP